MGAVSVKKATMGITDLRSGRTIGGDSNASRSPTLGAPGLALLPGSWVVGSSPVAASTRSLPAATPQSSGPPRGPIQIPIAPCHRWPSSIPPAVSSLEGYQTPTADRSSRQASPRRHPPPCACQPPLVGGRHLITLNNQSRSRRCLRASAMRPKPPLAVRVSGRRNWPIRTTQWVRRDRPQCEHTRHCEVVGRGLYQSHHCHDQTSLISGTLFAYTK